MAEHEHLILRKNGRWYFKRRVPIHAKPFDKREFVECSLKTDNLTIALAKRDLLNGELNDLWSTVSVTQSIDGDEFADAVRRCQALGFPYKEMPEILSGNLEDLIKRIEQIEKYYNAEPIARAALGTCQRPEIKLSACYDIHLRMAKGKLLGKSPDQIRKWENPRKKAIKNFIDVVGDLPIEKISVADALTFREWWLDRMELTGVTANSANKDMIHLWQIIKLTAQAEKIRIENPFQGLNLTEEENKRKSLTSENIISILTHTELMKMPPRFRELIAVMADEGVRVSEAAGLDDSEIFMGNEIPFINIQPNAHRAIKNRPSKRQLPLVGFALEIAAQTKLANLAEYRQSIDLASNEINSFLRSKNLLPSTSHSLYSMRHSFKDRLVAVDAPERIIKDLMGHSSGNVKYGDGSHLAHKLIWLKKISLKTD